MIDFKTKFLHFKIENTPLKDKWEEKIEKNALFLFCGPTKAFRYEIVFRGKVGRFACFEPTKAAKSLKKLQVHSVLYGQGKYVFKREFLYLERFHGRFVHFDIGVKEKPRNVPRFEIDFMLNFATCSPI